METDTKIKELGKLIWKLDGEISDKVKEDLGIEKEGDYYTVFDKMYARKIKQYYHPKTERDKRDAYLTNGDFIYVLRIKAKEEEKGCHKFPGYMIAIDPKKDWGILHYIGSDFYTRYPSSSTTYKFRVSEALTEGTIEHKNLIKSIEALKGLQIPLIRSLKKIDSAYN